MVRYLETIEPGHPGLSSLAFDAGFTETTLVRIEVGPDKKLFNVVKRHLCSIEYFAKAFSGEFEEAKSGTMSLPDDSPDAFAHFLDWHYRGFGNPINYDPGDFVMWTKFYIMMDKWCIHDVLPQIARQIWNMTQARTTNSVPADILKGQEWKAHSEQLFNCYNLCEDLPIRMLFVHAVFRENYLRATPVFASKCSGGDFNGDLARWSWLLERTREIGEEATRWRIWKHATLPEDQAHCTDRILMPLLFQSELWRADSIGIPSSPTSKDTTETRIKWLRSMFFM